MLTTTALWHTGAGHGVVVAEELESVQTLGVGTFSTVKLVTVTPSHPDSRHHSHNSLPCVHDET